MIGSRDVPVGEIPANCVFRRSFRIVWGRHGDRLIPQSAAIESIRLQHSGFRGLEEVSSGS